MDLNDHRSSAEDFNVDIEEPTKECLQGSEKPLFLDIGAVRKTPINKPIIKPAMVPVMEMRRVIPVPRKNCGPLSFKIFIIWLKKVCSSSLAIAGSWLLLDHIIHEFDLVFR